MPNKLVFKYNSSGYNNFSLDDLRDGTIPYIDKKLYFTADFKCYSYPLTLEDGHQPTDIEYYGKKKVRFELTNDRFMFNGEGRNLTNEDFEISYIEYTLKMKDAFFDEDAMRFVPKNVQYTDDDVLVFEAKFGDSTEFVTFGTYNLKNDTTKIADEYRSFVSYFSPSRIVFTDEAECTGYRISTENAHYYTEIVAKPYCHVKPSAYILNVAGDNKMTYLSGYASASVRSGSESYSDNDIGYINIYGDLRTSELKKSSKSTQNKNDKIRKYVISNWLVTLSETLETDSGKTRVDDKSTDKVAYMWYDSGSRTAYWWSDAKTVYLPTNCNSLFYGKTNMISIDMTGLDSSRVTDMRYMFQNCSNLTSVDLTGFDTSSVTSMSYMFYGCSSLQTLDLSSFDTSKVYNMSYLFYNCRLLKTIYVSSFSTASVYYSSYGSYIFTNCSALKGEHGTSYSSSHTDKTYARIDDPDNSKPGYFTYGCSSPNTPNDPIDPEAVYLTDEIKYQMNDNVQSFTRYEGSETAVLQKEGIVRIDDQTTSHKAYMWYDSGTGTEYWWSDAETVYLPKSCSGLFRNKPYLTSIDLTDLDASLSLRVNMMVSSCPSLTSFELCDMDFSNVKSFSCIVSDCASLSSLTLKNLDLSEVSSMSNLLSDCPSLTTVKLLSLNTPKLEKMKGMFKNCSYLTNVNLNGLDTSKVTDLSELFMNCTNLQTADVRAFDTSKVTTMESMFSGCSSLTDVNVSGFETRKVRYMHSMFKGCSSLTSIDLSTWYTPNLFGTRDMFYGCSELVTIYASDLWTVDYLLRHTDPEDPYNPYDDWDYYYPDGHEEFSYGDDMFGNFYNESSHCSKLVGGEGTTWDDIDQDINRYYYSDLEEDPNSGSFPSSTGDVRFARIDDPENGKPGYFTFKDPDEDELINGIHFVSDDSGSTPNGVTYGSGRIPERAKCVIDKNAAANTWTYTFSGINDTLTYHVWEDTLEGYTSNADPDNRQLVQDATFTIINTAPIVPQYGSLKVSKQLTAAEGASLANEDYQQRFTFNITLTKENGDPVTGTQFFGNIPFTNGKGTVTLTPNRGSTDNGVVMTDIPAGWNYKVTEVSVEGYQFTSNPNGTGTIAANIQKTAVITNQKQPAAVVDTVGAVKLTKTAVGNFETLDDEFDFTASFSDLTPRETYVYQLPNGETEEFTTDRTGGAELDLKLSVDQTIVFNDLDVGSSYRFTEAAGDYYSNYSVVDANNLNHIERSSGRTSGKQQKLSTAYEIADSGEDITVTFTNTVTKTQDITVKKVISPAAQNNTDPFNFTAKLSGLEPNSTIQTDIGKFKADGAGEIEFDFVLTDGGIVHIYGLPVKSTYQIIEKESSYAASYTVTDANDLGKIVKTSDTNGNETMKTLSTAAEKVDQGEDVEIVFTGTRVGHDVRITKYVDMTYGDTSIVNYSTLEFRFRVDFNNLTPNKTYSIAYTAEDMSGEILNSFTSTEAAHSETIILKHGETATIRGLDQGVTYKVTELYDDDLSVHYQYIPSFAVTANEGATIVRQSAQLSEPGALSTAVEAVEPQDLDVNIVFTNTCTFIPYDLPEAGFKDQRAMIVIAFVGMSIFAVMFVVSRKRRKKERID